MRQRFIQSFSTSGTEHEAIDAERLGKPYVAFIYDGQYIDWNTLSPTPPVPPAPTEIVCTYSVASTSTAVRIAGNVEQSNFRASLENGTEIPLPEIGWKDYNFPATGQQKVTFTSLGTRTSLPGFDGCPKLVDIFIPEGYTKIRMNGFESCTGLTSITIPNSVTGITGGSNFAYCSRLKEVNIGTGIKELGGQVFYGCTVLSSITINAVTPPTIGSDVLGGVQNAYFYVPDEAVAAYKAAPTWSSYANRVKGISEKTQ